MLRGPQPSSAPWFVGLPHPSPGALLPGPGCFWIQSPYPTGYRVSLVKLICIWIRFAKSRRPKKFGVQNLPHIRKKNRKNWKIYFACILRHCATFRSKIPIWPLLRGGGGLHVVNWNRAKKVYLYIKWWQDIDYIYVACVMVTVLYSHYILLGKP